MFPFLRPRGLGWFSFIEEINLKLLFTLLVVLSILMFSFSQDGQNKQKQNKQNKQGWIRA
jgi:hypothetical protein